MLRKRAFTSFLCIALFAGGAANAALKEPKNQPPVIMIRFDFYPKDSAQIRVLEHRLERAIKHAGVGELGETEFYFDGNEGFLYMYGPDPDRLYVVVSPILKSSKLMKNAEVEERYGSRTKTFVINRDGTR